MHHSSVNVQGSKIPAKKVSIYFRNRANDPSPMGAREFTLIKCPSFKKCVKLQEIRQRSNALRQAINASKFSSPEKGKSTDFSLKLIENLSTEP